MSMARHLRQSDDEKFSPRSFVVFGTASPAALFPAAAAAVLLHWGIAGSGCCGIGWEDQLIAGGGDNVTAGGGILLAAAAGGALARG